MPSTQRLALTMVAAGGLLLGLARCDTVEPEAGALLVVEGFFDAGAPLPVVTLRQARPLSEPYADSAALDVSGAEVTVHLGTDAFDYKALEGLAGRYAPATPALVPDQTPLRLEARWRGQHAQATSFVPVPISIDSVHLSVPEQPVQAVLLDSLIFDSLSVDAQEGFIYPVEVSLWWVDDRAALADSSFWIQTSLRPFTTFSSTVIDFFLRPEQIFRETSLPRDARGRRRWTGVYAVPVEQAEDPLPVHRLKVALLRSGQDYARFAASRDAPERREPISNVTGALGIVAGISVDSLQLQVDGSEGVAVRQRE